METRANNALIGLFTIAVVAAALGFVVWFARLAEGSKVDHYRIVFTGSITGLSEGSSVLFNGIRVGQVDSLDILPEDPSRVVGRVTVKQGTPVKVDTRARIEFQGLTGGAYIQLYGGSANAPTLEPPADQQMATIYAERSELQNLVDGARDTVTQAAATLTRIDEFIRKN
jgi:phospholipid/cholesterol/gamma-HCH transport system substrate-binding protein